MNKPDWKDAPEWARFLAMDADGDWFWFEEKPTRKGAAWCPVYGRYGQWESCQGDWTASLEERPL
jgi:hypothetical protein